MNWKNAFIGLFSIYFLFMMVCGGLWGWKWEYQHPREVKGDANGEVQPKVIKVEPIRTTKKELIKTTKKEVVPIETVKVPAKTDLPKTLEVEPIRVDPPIEISDFNFLEAPVPNDTVFDKMKFYTDWLNNLRTQWHEKTVKVTGHIEMPFKKDTLRNIPTYHTRFWFDLPKVSGGKRLECKCQIQCDEITAQKIHEEIPRINHLITPGSGGTPRGNAANGFSLLFTRDKITFVGVMYTDDRAFLTGTIFPEKSVLIKVARIE